MFRFAASYSRRALLAAAVAIVSMVSMPAFAAPVEPLVTPQWLNENRSKDDVVVLDIRSAIDGGGVEAYLKAHIPGAVHSDYDKAGWRVTRNGVPFMLPTPAELEKLIGETGIDEDSHVVIVPAGVSATDFGSAARVYWTLKVAGHPAVSVLDGGFAAWQAASYPVESGKNPPSPKIFSGKDRQFAAGRGRSGGAQFQRDAARCAAGELLRGPAEGAGFEGLWPHPWRDQSRQRDVLRSGDQQAALEGRACRDREQAAGWSGRRVLQHRPLGGDQLVRAVGDARPARRAPL